MQYDLLADRGQPIDNDMPLMTLLYAHRRYKKEREEAANKNKS
jgi:hypothetical protein